MVIWKFQILFGQRYHMTLDINREVNLTTLPEIYRNFPNYHSNCIFMRVSTFGKSLVP